MKFAQFIELEETLAKNGHTIEELKESIKKGDNPELLLEFWGLSKWVGLDKSWLANTGVLGKSNKLQKMFAEQLKGLEKEVSDKMASYTKKMIETKKSLKAEMARIQKAGNPIPKKANEQLMNIEGQIIKIVNKMIDKFGDLKTKEINAKLDAANVKDKTRTKLDLIWESLLSDFKVGLLTTLYKQRVIETDAAAKFIKKLKEEGKRKKDEQLSSGVFSEDKEDEEDEEEKPIAEGTEFVYKPLDTNARIRVKKEGDKWIYLKTWRRKDEDSEFEEAPKVKPKLDFPKIQARITDQFRESQTKKDGDSLDPNEKDSKEKAPGVEGSTL